MIQLRKTNHRNTASIYANKPIIRVTKIGKFTVSHLVVEQLKLDVKTEGLMFGMQDKKLHVFKEKKESDNYHLAKADASTFRFKSKELHSYIADFYKIAKDKIFIIEIKEDNTFLLG